MRMMAWIKGAFLLLAAVSSPVLAGIVYLDELGLSALTCGWQSPRAKASVEGSPLSIGGVKYQRGIGTHANSEWWLDLNGKAKKFTAWVGIDDEKEGCGTAVFRVVADQRIAFDSGTMTSADGPKKVDVDLAGVKRIKLEVTDAEDNPDCDHADWAEAAVEYEGEGKPAASVAVDEPPPPITPGGGPQTRINGPRVVGTTPGRPFLFRVPVTGATPFTFAARGLPGGLKLDPATGIISGSLARAVTHRVRLKVAGPGGTAERVLTLVAGKGRLALTPPMGWNSWNVWGCDVTQERVKAAADALVSSGLAAHGFSAVNIDDCWEGPRDKQGNITTNEKFPDMKGLADYVHSLGLKLGIYSGPGPKTCAGYPASWKHEAQDAKTYAGWGIDYLKYDWCSYGEIAKDPTHADHVKPYAVMRKGLDRCGRDIVFSFCQYGMDKVWEWGEKTGGNLWRTTGDIVDSWGSISEIAFNQTGISKWAGPGHWNDPDMLVVGQVGWSSNLHPTRLTRNEQIMHVTAWCMLAAPLLIGCDLTKLDAFTLALLTNDEVLEVDQDPLGKAAEVVSRDGVGEVWVRPLFDGTIGVAMFNQGFERARMTAKWADLGLSGPQPVRDLWLERDLPPAEGEFSAEVPAHGAVLVRIGQPGRTEY